MSKTGQTPTLRKLDQRLTTVEQILPTLATKEDLRRAIEPLATREELRATIDQAVARLATKEEVALLATREEVALLATKEEVALLATKEEVALLATREEMRTEGERTRRHFDVVAESLRSEIRLIAEGHVHLSQRMDASEARTAHAIASLDLRVTRLEAKRGK
jgi:hypothetical protein